MTKRVCILTGASGRLGTAFCRAYADKYEIVAVYWRNEPVASSQLRRFVDPLRPATALAENESPVFAFKADLARVEERSRVVEIALARFGRIDLLVNAAVHSVWAPMIESRALSDSMSAQFHMNTVVPMQLALECARQFWRDRDAENRAARRNVVNVSSVAGVRIFPGSGQSVYAATKAALNHLTLHMASEFEVLGLRVNAVVPNTFSKIVSVDRVTEAIHALDSTEDSGRLVLVDRDLAAT